MGSKRRAPLNGSIADPKRDRNGGDEHLDVALAVEPSAPDLAPVNDVLGALLHIDRVVGTRPRPHGNIAGVGAAGVERPVADGLMGPVAGLWPMGAGQSFGRVPERYTDISVRISSASLAGVSAG
jgi:hypothetical protein